MDNTKPEVDMQTITSDAPSPKGIFDLPAEVRNMIWESVVVVPKICVNSAADWAWNHPILYMPFSRRGFDERDAPVSRPQKKEYPDLRIFLVCRKIYEEASHIYYTKNNFAFCILDDGRSHSGLLGTQRILQRQTTIYALQHIRHIELDILDHTNAARSYDRSFRASVTRFAKFITRDMRIQHLTLHIRTWDVDKAYAGFSRWKQLVDLSKIPNIRRLTVKLDLNAPHGCRCHPEPTGLDAAGISSIAANTILGVGIIEQLRSNMLENGAKLGRKMIRASTVPRYWSSGGPPVGLTGILLEADNNIRGECLLPVPKHPGDVYPGSLDRIEFHPDITGTLNDMDEQQYVQLREAAHEFGRKYHPIDFEEDYDFEDGFEDEYEDKFEEVTEDELEDEFEDEYVDEDGFGLRDDYQEDEYDAWWGSFRGDGD